MFVKGIRLFSVLNLSPYLRFLLQTNLSIIRALKYMRILSVQTRDSKHAYFLGLKEKIKWLVDVAVKSM